MKIAIFSDCYLDLTGGIVTAINAEKAELERRGHTVYVFSSAYPRSQQERRRLAKSHIYPVPTCKVWGRGVTPIARRPRVIEKYLLKNFPEIREFDVFYVHYEAGCSIAGLRLAKKLGIKSVQVMHGREDMGEALIIPLGLRTFVATMLNWFHAWYLPHSIKITKDNYLATTLAKAKMWALMVNHANQADVVIAPSDYFRKMLIYYGVKKPVVALHHGIADDYLKKTPPARELKPGEPLEIIWHSRLSPEKRLMPFLEALNIITPNPPIASLKTPLVAVKNFKNREKFTPCYHLAVYGDGPEAVNAKAYARLHRLNVTFYGATKFAQIWPQLKKAHLDILVSYNYDTFGMTLIEAAAAGTPALIVDPDLEEIVPKNGYILAKAPSPVAIAEALNLLLKHPENIAKMSEAMLNSRAAISNSMKIDQLEQIFSGADGA